jgi:hypothetical protein
MALVCEYRTNIALPELKSYSCHVLPYIYDFFISLKRAADYILDKLKEDKISA